MTDHPTVDDLLARTAAARLARLAEQRFVIERLFPPPVLTRRQRAARKVRGRVHGAREAVALTIAPWLYR